uniref:A disintegrin and metalloproteinase with thrombospondin motifs 18 isoform X1 n=1 Tax=Ciona intestinalis TaxID=7719 RepID=UPI0002B8DB7D|nr:A disintegrin and metalloproteinase with thrombospondin motifs 18 isoform X1 [Ciona intestinalis]|eukprot:XP_018673460.1 A disintegrin and metalloproteinase with thrombospondin motifs 18 isoform X1 [Ciona intestinalis]
MSQLLDLMWRRKCVSNNGVLKTNCLIDGILIASILLCVQGAETAREIWPGHYTDAHREVHKVLRQTTHAYLEDFQVVVPFRTDSTYNHLTNHLPHKRIRRDSDDVRRDVSSAAGDELHYVIPGYGERFELRLLPNNALLAPTFSVKRIKREAEETEENIEQWGCHYHGRMTSHGKRRVAMSTCEGLTGLLRTSEDDFLVEPLPHHINHTFPDRQHPHIIYKRRHLYKHRLHYCGKKKRYPVTIPDTENHQIIKLLSNGEIELESDEQTPVTGGHRRKRSSGDFNDVSNRVNATRPTAKNVETLVVADAQMIRNHERDHRDITTYILTVMNMVSGLFSDRSMDGTINVVLVGIMLLEDNGALHLDHKADEALSSFCHWQANLNNTNGGKPDHSILLTGIDICVDKNKPCETLGLAQIGGMCSERNSCTINEDMGLGLAFTVAHESGHSFGMKHDGEGNLCSKRDGHIMSPTLNGLNGVFTWSTCSRNAIGDFLQNVESQCLDDHPSPMANLNFPDQLPGEIYDAASQCKWQFGADAITCIFRYEHKQASVCKVLWCQRSESSRCETKYMPAAEGTNCGNNMWCRRGVCVTYGDPGPDAIDGGWGDYASWSPCTRTCGGGVQHRMRACNNPTPRYGGRHCEGEEKIYKLCNTEPCAPNQVSFREQQCAQYNRRAYRRQYFHWTPFTKYSSFGRDQCELLCKAEGYDFFDMLADKVIDGTPCDASSTDVCIQGKCKHVGCDFVLGSNATFDSCGVCNGDNSTCQSFNGSYDDNVRDSGYYDVIRIPRGARSVKIWENKCCTHSYIAVRSASNSDRYYLNGNWEIDLYGETTFAGAKWFYNRKSFQSETLLTPGPLGEELLIQVLVVAQNPGISYSYTTQVIDNRLPGLRTNSAIQVQPPSYNWSSTSDSCSATCAGGTQTVHISCVMDGTTVVDESHCDRPSRPSLTKECNTQACPARWHTTEWGQCSRTCGGGLQLRQVTCKSKRMNGDVYVGESHCNNKRKPPRTQQCMQTECPAYWHTGEWSKCSRACGRGVRNRHVRCRSGTRSLRNARCDRRVRPKSREPCLVTYCQRKYQWFITAWDQCSVTCGEGIQRRELKCSFKGRNGRYRPVVARRCRRARRPEVSLEKTCTLSTCPSPRRISSSVVTPRSNAYNSHFSQTGAVPSYRRRSARWIVGTWQKCSVSCGGGLQMRAVRCLQFGRPSHSCSISSKAPNKRACNTYKCRKKIQTACEDTFKWCYLVPQHGQCSHKYFGVACCKTCKASSGNR